MCCGNSIQECKSDDLSPKMVGLDYLGNKIYREPEVVLCPLSNGVGYVRPSYQYGWSDNRQVKIPLESYKSGSD